MFACSLFSVNWRKKAKWGIDVNGKIGGKNGVSTSSHMDKKIQMERIEDLASSKHS